VKEMSADTLNLEGFREFLSKNKFHKEQIDTTAAALTNFQEFLKKEDAQIASFPRGKLLEYTEMLVSQHDEKAVRALLNGLYTYASFTEVYTYIEELIGIIESYNAMDTLSNRVAEWYGEEMRDEIFTDIAIPPVGVDPEKKPETTKIVMNRLEENLGEEKTIELLRPCLHGRPGDDTTDRVLFLTLGDLDKFLAQKREAFIDEVEKHRDEGTPMFAQFVDDAVVEYVKGVPSMDVGVRKGNKIIVSKIPYQIKKFLSADDERMKGFYLCYCPWVRGALKKGEANEISSNFCYCSGGYFKLYWDFIFDQPVTVEPIESPLWNGGVLCTFAVEIPEDIMETYVLSGSD
jgi:hypothetical protein